MTVDTEPSAQPVAPAPTDESELLSTARRHCGDPWELGRLAAEWTTRFARSRGDAAFAESLDGLLTVDQVYQRRRVWETFGNLLLRHSTTLKWSHFYVVLTANNAASLLEWARDNGATVDVLRAYQRLEHGVATAGHEPSTLNPQPSPQLSTSALGGVELADEPQPAYAPYHQGARGSAPATATVARPGSALRVINAAIKALAALTSEVLDDDSVSNDVLLRLVEALDQTLTRANGEA